MYVCLCKSLDENSLAEMKKNGANTLKKVSKICGAGTDCGSCSFKINRLLQENNEEDLEHDSIKNQA